MYHAQRMISCVKYGVPREKVTISPMFSPVTSAIYDWWVGGGSSTAGQVQFESEGGASCGAVAQVVSGFALRVKSSVRA